MYALVMVGAIAGGMFLTMMLAGGLASLCDLLNWRRDNK